MEYLTKAEVMEYLIGYRTELTLQGKDGDTVTTIINRLNRMYTYRPTLQAQWVRKGKNDIIICSRCGYKTLIYKNSLYCPNCGKSMVNGKKYND